MYIHLRQCMPVLWICHTDAVKLLLLLGYNRGKVLEIVCIDSDAMR